MKRVRFTMTLDLDGELREVEVEAAVEEPAEIKAALGCTAEVRLFSVKRQPCCDPHYNHCACHAELLDDLDVTQIGAISDEALRLTRGKAREIKAGAEIRVLWSGFGIGTYMYRDEEAATLVAEIRTALGFPPKDADDE